MQGKRFIAVAFFADGGDGQFARRGGDGECSLYIGKAVVLVFASADNDVVASGRRGCRGLARDGGFHGENLFGLVKNKSAVREGKYRVLFAVRTGSVIGRYGEQSLFYGKCPVLAGDVVVLIFTSADDDVVCTGRRGCSGVARESGFHGENLFGLVKHKTAV